jgi:hypothetical protein
MYPSQQLPGYVAAGARGRTVVALLLAEALVQGGFVTALQFSVRTVDGAPVLALSPLAVLLMSVAVLVVMVLTITFFCMWLYRAHANLRALGVFGTRSSGWAVGSFFVPFVNLVVPYYVVKEVMVGSDDRTIGRGTHPGEPPGRAPVVGWWWACYLVSGFLGVFESMVPAMIANVVRLAAALLLIKIIRDVATRQERRANLLATQAAPGDAFAGPRPTTA